jgi:hypothetical protein
VVSYASVAELKTYDSSVTASDPVIQAALDFATALVTARARRDFSFSSATALTVNDVRTRNVVLSLPFADVTAVEVGGYEMPDSSYAVEPWGIRLFSDPGIDSDGFGPSVMVTATFTSSVPELIKRATILLALDELPGGPSDTDSVLPKLIGKLKSFSVEGLSATVAAGPGDDRVPTGNDDADRLIDLVVGSEAGVV